jgi:hypothetical protein
MKTFSFVRTQSTLGTQGFGWVLGRPNGSNDNQVIVYTNGTWAGTSTSAMSTTATSAIAVANHNGPFSSADLGPDVAQWRLVACGVRVRYSGTTLNQSGRISTLEHPNHLTFSGFNMNEVMEFDNAVPLDFDRKWHTCTYQPMAPDEMTYTQNSTAPVSTGNYFFALVFNGVAGEAYSIEYVQHCEYIGQLARGKTPTMTDTSATQQIASKIGSVASHVLSSAADHISKNPGQTVNVIRTLLAYSQTPSQRAYNMQRIEL